MSNWISIWGNAEGPSNHNEQIYSKNITLRYLIPVMTNGSKLRLFFSNKYTEEAVVLDKVTVGISDGTDKTEGIKAVTFKNKGKLKLKAHATAFSDELAYEVKKGEYLSVSIYLKKLTNLSTGTTAYGKYSKGYLGEGNCTELETMPLYVSRDASKNYLLYGVDVLADSEDAKALVCFGDSITAMDWPDELKALLLDSDVDVSVVRKAIGGNRILRTYKNWLNIHYGESGVGRIDDDLSEISGADTMVVLHGINDIIHPNGTVYRPLEMLPTPEEMINGYRKYIASAKKHGLKIYLATILPFREYGTWSVEREAIRTEVNEWIRTTDEIDGVIDFDLAVRNPENPVIGTDGYICPDGLHPSLEGFKVMAKYFFDQMYNK